MVANEKVKGLRKTENVLISLGDGARKIFLNTKGTNIDEVSLVLREFLDYVKNPETAQIKNKKIKDLDDRVNQVKIDAEVRLRYMTLKNWMDEMRYEVEQNARVKGEIEGATKTKIEIIRAKYVKGYDIEKSAEILEIDKEFISDVYKLFQMYPEYSDAEISAAYIEKE